MASANAKLADLEKKEELTVDETDDFIAFQKQKDNALGRIELNEKLIASAQKRQDAERKIRENTIKEIASKNVEEVDLAAKVDKALRDLGSKHRYAQLNEQGEFDKQAKLNIDELVSYGLSKEQALLLQKQLNMTKQELLEGDKQTAILAIQKRFDDKRKKLRRQIQQRFCR